MAAGKSIEELKEIMDMREPLYLNCDYIIDASSADLNEIVNKIITVYKDKNQIC